MLKVHVYSVFLFFTADLGNFTYSALCFHFVLQSKEIGLQMHEELLKVTNELYTVSNFTLAFVS